MYKKWKFKEEKNENIFFYVLYNNLTFNHESAFEWTQKKKVFFVRIIFLYACIMHTTNRKKVWEEEKWNRGGEVILQGIKKVFTTHLYPLCVELRSRNICSITNSRKRERGILCISSRSKITIENCFSQVVWQKQ